MDCDSDGHKTFGQCYHLAKTAPIKKILKNTKKKSTQKRKPRRGFKILAYIGWLRPHQKPDHAEALIKSLQESRHEIVGLITIASDPIIAYAKKFGITCVELPMELGLPISRIKYFLEFDPSFQARFQKWLERLSQLKADIGVTIWGNWIPPDLFNLPKHGFLNYHPAPLPELRGMEPDTFAILQNRKTVYGTIHKVSENFDTGDIIQRTKKLKLKRYSTPSSLLNRLYTAGVKSMVMTLNKLRSGHGKFTTQKSVSKEASWATLAMARRESVINWTDSLSMIDRRLRAFVGQDNGIRLKAVIKDSLTHIVDLETVKGFFPGEIGEIIGYYKGKGKYYKMPIVRVSEGAVILKLGKKLKIDPYHSTLPECPQKYEIPAARRKKTTKKKLVEESVKRFFERKYQTKPLS